MSTNTAIQRIREHRRTVAITHLVDLLRDGYRETYVESDAKALYSLAKKAGYTVGIRGDTAVKVIAPSNASEKYFLVDGRVQRWGEFWDELTPYEQSALVDVDLFDTLSIRGTDLTRIA